MKNIKAFLSFSRPHTIIGTTLSVTGLYLIALTHAGTGQIHWQILLMALLSCLGANIYIVGLNQLTDVEIDRINKPDLPLAAGIFSRQTGRIIITVSLIFSLLIAIREGAYLLLTVVLSLIIGTAYSLPPIRLKRFHFWAAASIFTVRGVIVNIFLFLHFNSLLTGSANIPPQVWALTAFIFGLSLVIAWFKDIPDMEGDSRFKIMTLSLTLGARKVFNIGRGMLAACYLGLVVAGIYGIPGVNGAVLVITHLGLLILMWLKGRAVEMDDKASIARYYLFTWGLFFSEYIFFPLACILA
jgi:homogentisate phytyltransferase/homogentisate geranylgeranyltransferase